MVKARQPNQTSGDGDLEDLELTEDEKNRIELSLLNKIRTLQESSEKLEMFVEVDSNPALDGLSTIPEGELTREKIESLLNTTIPDDIEVIKYYSFLNSFLVRSDIKSLKNIFKAFNVVKIQDAAGNIKPMDTEQAADETGENPDTSQSEKDQDNELF